MGSAEPGVIDGIRAAMRLGMKLGLVDARVTEDGATEVRVYLDGARVVDAWVTMPELVPLLDWTMPRTWRPAMIALANDVARGAVGRFGKLVVRKRAAVAIVEWTNEDL